MRTGAAALLLIALMGASPVVPVLAQSGSTSWAVQGNSFTYSISESYSVGGSTTMSTSTSASLTVTVESVSGTSVTLQSVTAGSSPSSITGDLGQPIGSNGFDLYIPPAQESSTLSGLVATFEHSLGFNTTGFTVTPTVSQKTVSTGVGDVNSWTLDVSASGSSTMSGTTVQGQGSGSISYDSGLGLLVAVHVSGSGTISTSSGNSPASITVDLSMTSKPASVQLTGGAASGLLGLSTTSWALVVVAIIVVVAIAVVAMLRMRKGKQAQAPAAPEAPMVTAPPSTS
jgi:membrane protein implicated in regulation of membrane protease activity